MIERKNKSERNYFTILFTLADPPLRTEQQDSPFRIKEKIDDDRIDVWRYECTSGRMEQGQV